MKRAGAGLRKTLWIVWKTALAFLSVPAVLIGGTLALVGMVSLALAVGFLEAAGRWTGLPMRAGGQLRRMLRAAGDPEPVAPLWPPAPDLQAAPDGDGYGPN